MAIPTPLYYWSFDGESDFSSIASANDVTNAITTYEAEGIQGGSRLFPTSNDSYLTTTNTMPLQANSTFVALVKQFNQGGKNNYGLFSFSASTSNWDNYIQLSNTGAITIKTNGETYTSSAKINYSHSIWILITITTDSSGNVHIYINDEFLGEVPLISNGSNGGLGSNTPGLIRIGSGGGSNFFSGHMDEVAYFNTYLNSSQVSEYYNGGLFTFYNGTTWNGVELQPSNGKLLFFKGGL